MPSEQEKHQTPKEAEKHLRISQFSAVHTQHSYPKGQKSDFKGNMNNHFIVVYMFLGKL